jgi:hypothetical protein
MLELKRSTAELKRAGETLCARLYEGVRRAALAQLAALLDGSSLAAG